MLKPIDFASLPVPILPRRPGWVALYNTAWKLAAKSIRQASNGRPYMDAAWDRKLNYQWVWDTCFMCMYCRYAPDQFPGVQSLDNFYDLQQKDGYISMTYCLDTGEEPWPGRINPPLFAWAEWEYYLTTGDASRLRKVTRRVGKLMQWVDKNRRNKPHRHLRAKDGPYAGTGQSASNYQLYYFDDAGSSGMDDSPRTPRIYEAGQHYDWIDLSCQMAQSFRLLSLMHTALGESTRANHWQRRFDATAELINSELWCERSRFYHDRMIPTNFVASKTVAGFWPLVAGICPAKRVADLTAHLLNKNEFNRPTPVPSLSADDPNYTDDGVYWRGGVWAPTNYMVTRGLDAVGQGDLAHDITVRYLDAMEQTFARARPATLWECYSPESPAPGKTAYHHERAKPDFVGWSGLGPIAMLIEHVIGLNANAPAKTVTWDVRLTEEHGIKNLGLGKLGRLNVLAAKRASVSAPVKIEAMADTAMTLVVRNGKKHSKIRLKAGVVVRASV